jgi:hypothetical protein
MRASLSSSKVTGIRTNSSSPASRSFLRLSADGSQAEQKLRTKKLPHVYPFHAGGSITSKC